jgi:hypothetical protein
VSSENCGQPITCRASRSIPDPNDIRSEEHEIAFGIYRRRCPVRAGPPPDLLVSPDIHPDRTVTFRIRAPKASEVGLYGAWVPVGKLELMTKDAEGIWNITSAT